MTALLCLNDRMAIGAVQQARAMGRQVPEDVSIVGYDNIPSAASLLPPLTTVDQQAPELGRIAAHMLFEVLKDKTPKSIILPTRLVLRESSSPVR
jgi:LacI family repressor for deo operon, udp, cdd, tsx, nupC, and nupG